jgi:hypothetical protein
MDRQMFKKGGAAGFPDLSGDGQVTQRDILMGRGVIKMQQGGMAPMPAPMPAGPGPEVMAGAMGQIDPNSIDINQAAQGAMQQGIDPAMLEGMLGQYASQMDDLENAEDYEQVINGIRGDTAPIEQRYMELAGIVGQEDAQQTPESVLALVQPVMLMASVDQGIGGLAMDEMNAPVEGAMAEGIMSTVNMGAQEPTQGLGGPAPVNFNQGGAVQYMQTGGAADPRMQALYEQNLDMFSQVDDPAQRAADLEEQRDLTQAQMLFDVAQGALMFATPGERRMSPAERLAQAFTPVLGNIGARAGEFGKFKQAQAAQDKQLRLGALQAAQTQRQGELTRESAAASVKPGDTYQIKDGEGKVLWQGPIGTVGQQNELMTKYPTAVSVTEVKAPEGPDFVTFINPNDQTDYFTFDKNNLSAENQGAIETVRLAKADDGTGFKYRITGQYTPSKDGETGSSRVNFILRSTGETEMVDLSTPEGQTRANELEELGYLKAGVAPLDSDSVTAKLQVFVNRQDPTDIKRFDMNDPEQRKEANELGSNYLPTAMPSMKDLAEGTSLGNSYEAKFMQLTSSPETLEQYADGTLNAFDANLINSFITQETRMKPVVDKTTGQATLVPGFVLAPALQQAIEQRTQIEGATLPLLNGKRILDPVAAQLDDDPNTTGRIKFLPDGTIDFDTFKDDNTFIISGLDLTQSQDWKSAVTRFFNVAAGQLNIGSGYAGEGGRITSQTDTELNALAKKINRIARQGVDGRVFAFDLEMIKEETDGFRPGGIKTDYKARDQLVTVRNTLAQMYTIAYDTIQNPQDDPTGQRLSAAKGIFPEVENLLAETTAAIAIYDRYLGGNPMDATVKDRAATTSVTGALPRASGSQ